MKLLNDYIDTIHSESQSQSDNNQTNSQTGATVILMEEKKSTNNNDSTNTYDIRRGGLRLPHSFVAEELESLSHHDDLSMENRNTSYSIDSSYSSTTNTSGKTRKSESEISIDKRGSVWKRRLSQLFSMAPARYQKV